VGRSWLLGLDRRMYTLSPSELTNSLVCGIRVSDTP
jgi:hypothetical protein